MEFHEHLRKRFLQLSKPLEPISTQVEPVLEELENIRVLCYDFYGTLFISSAGDIGIDDGNMNEMLFVEAIVHSNIDILNDEAGPRGLKIYNDAVESEMAALREKGIEFPEPDIRNVWIKVLLKMKTEGLISEPSTADQMELLAVEFEARMNPVWPMHDAHEVLHHFKNRPILQGMISNSQFYTPLLLEALLNRPIENLGFKKELMHWSFEEQQKKPAISFFEGFLKKLKNVDSSIKPDEVLYVGNDMLKDIYPAQKVGMKTALFAGDERSLKWRKDDERCAGLKADVVITELRQLKGVVL